MLHYIKSVVLFIIISEVFSEVNTDGKFSDNALATATIFKCKCKANEVLSEGQCIPGENPLRLWDYVNQKELIVDISNFSSAVINPVQCQNGFTKLTLDGSQFVIYTNGLLDNLILIDQKPTQQYCVDHISTDVGLTLVADVCEANPVIPLCCPPGYLTIEDGSCLYRENLPFNPKLVGGFPWSIYNVTEQKIHCEIGKVLRTELISLPSEDGASLVSYPLGSMLQWFSLYYSYPQYITNDEYCVSVIDSEFGYLYFAQFCVPDPKIQYIETCKNATCVRKCCPHGYIYDLVSNSCAPNVNFTINYKFIDSNGDKIDQPEDLTLTIGFPFCEELHMLPENHRAMGIIKFYSNGSLMTSSEVSHSSLNYCVDGFAYNSSDPNRTVENSAFLCVEELTEKCAWRWIIGSVLLGISCLFFIITLVIFIGIEELRSRMVGKCLINQVFALLIAYGTLIFLQNVDSYSEITCNLPGTIEHISILAAFFWLNVMCFDMWSKMRQMKVASTKTSTGSKKFKLYCLYAWGVPLIIASARVIVDNVPKSEDLHWLVRANLGRTHCFFSGNFSLAKWIYLYAPILVLLLLNLSFFIHVAVIIVRTKRQTAKFTAGENSGTTGRRLDARKERAKMYLKLFLVMGISWLLEIIMWIAVPENDCYFWGFDIINMVQGVSIFFIFVCKKSTIQKVKEKFGFTIPVLGRTDEYHLTDSETKQREQGKIKQQKFEE